jgi:hypothetical protein
MLPATSTHTVSSGRVSNSSKAMAYKLQTDGSEMQALPFQIAAGYHIAGR